MPSTSKKQMRFMAAAAHNPAFAKKAGVPVRVAREFNLADMQSSMRKPRGMGKLEKMQKMG